MGEGCSCARVPDRIVWSQMDRGSTTRGWTRWEGMYVARRMLNVVGAAWCGPWPMFRMLHDAMHVRSIAGVTCCSDV